MTGKFLLGWFLLTTLFSCSIISDDHLDKLPDDVHVREVEIVYGRWVGNPPVYETKRLGSKLIITGNTIEMNWPVGVDFFFLDKKVSKTTILLNGADYAEKITSVFDDGSEIIDELKYNSSNQVIELTNSFFKDNLKLFYKNNIIDSVTKTRTLANNTTQFGFYKQIDAENMISVFPYDNTKSYSALATISNGCTSGGSFPSNNNDFNKTVYKSLVESTEDYGYYSNENFIIDYQQRVNNLYYQNYINLSSYKAINYFGKTYSTGLQAYECGGSLTGGYMNIFMLLPDLVPDPNLLYRITIENEVKWVNNNPKTQTEWWINSLQYKFKPFTK